VRRWQPRRGECEREAFGVELANDIRERGATVRIGAARSETNPGSVTVALGRAQFGAQSFFLIIETLQ
jgi:hypothetical protein